MNPIRDHLTRYHPRFAQADYSIVDRWVEAGCDLERDVLPVIREWTGRKPDIYSLGFFTRYVMAAKETREAKPLPNDPEAIHRRARAYAYLIRRLGRCMPWEQRWLEGYEARFGAVDNGVKQNICIDVK